jgi:hypothetical protein
MVIGARSSPASLWPHRRDRPIDAVLFSEGDFGVVPIHTGTAAEINTIRLCDTLPTRPLFADVHILIKGHFERRTPPARAARCTTTRPFAYGAHASGSRMSPRSRNLRWDIAADRLRR